MCTDIGSCVAKFLLCTFNFIFFILGTVVLSVGIWVAIDKASFIALLKMVENEDLEQFTQPAVIEQLAYVLIVCGAIIFFLSFLGYCGAIRESQCMLTTYASFLVLILIAQITIGSLVAVYKNEARAQTKLFLQTTINRYYSTANTTDAVSLMWNELMAEMNCCGVNNYTDFGKAEKWNRYRGDHIIPEACCHLQERKDGRRKAIDENCTKFPSESNSNYLKGCYDTLVDWILAKQHLLIIILVFIILIELLLIFLSFCLCKSIDKYQVIRL